MGSGRGGLQGLIARAGRTHLRGDLVRSRARPGRLIADGDRNVRLRHAVEGVREPLGVVPDQIAALGSDHEAGFYQLPVVDIEQVMRRPTSQQSVAFRQHAAVPAQGRQRTRIRQRGGLIEEPPQLRRRPVDGAKIVVGEQDAGHGAHHLGAVRYPRAVDPYLSGPVPAQVHGNVTMPRPCRARVPVEHERAPDDALLRTRADQIPVLARSKRSAKTQHVDRFEQVGLPLAVLSDQEHAVLSFQAVQPERLQVAKALEAQGRQPCPPRRHSQGVAIRPASA